MQRATMHSDHNEEHSDQRGGNHERGDVKEMTFSWVDLACAMPSYSNEPIESLQLQNFVLCGRYDATSLTALRSRPSCR